MAFLSIDGNQLIVLYSFIRNMRSGYISLHPSFKAHAGMSDGPGGLFALRLVSYFLHSTSLVNRKKIAVCRA